MSPEAFQKHVSLAMCARVGSSVKNANILTTGFPRSGTSIIARLLVRAEKTLIDEPMLGSHLPTALRASARGMKESYFEPRTPKEWSDLEKYIKSSVEKKVLRRAPRVHVWGGGFCINVTHMAARAVS